MSTTHVLVAILVATIVFQICNSTTIPKKDICRLPKEVGDCRALQPRYYFSTNTNSCEEFNYGGCGGNDNRFRSEKECKRVCIEGRDCPPVDPLPPGCRYKRQEDGCNKASEKICT